MRAMAMIFVGFAAMQLSAESHAADAVEHHATGKPVVLRQRQTSRCQPR